MKFKYYLRGIGIGVVVTTFIFMILISIHKNEERMDSASKNNMESKTVAAAEDDTEKKAQSDATPSKQISKEDKDVEKDTRPKENTKPKEDAKPKADTGKDQDTETETQQTETEEDETENESSDKVRFEISGGEFSDAICRKLQEEGLISDAKEFNRFLIEKDYDNSILPGIYDIPRDATYEEIAVLLTSKVE
ncbi:MAG: endolytic transglycosylase MltG [Eubacterium sp.]|nr:endolytic transglycosylase MltG [Eubacterium sp.]